ncbi:MAG: hypothetical protein HOP28_05315, partial [Gemmatimonadales bacterium]|nr:hypothetical protein [Gemmatimonadales bacterium]
MSQEPEYLQRLRAQQQKQHKGGAGQGTERSESGQAYSIQEQEVLRWARKLAQGTELRSIRNLAGARFAVLVRLQSA